MTWRAILVLVAVFGILAGWQGVLTVCQAQQSQRLARLERMIQFEHREVGRIEERSLRLEEDRDRLNEATEAWREALRLDRVAYTDRVVAWLGRALGMKHGNPE